MLAARFARIGAAVASATLVLLAASSARAADVKLPDGSIVSKVDFERHLMGVFGRMGCNSGSCHGSFQGKGGFRLSLFAYDPEKDFYAITREANSRVLALKFNVENRDLGSAVTDGIAERERADEKARAATVETANLLRNVVNVQAQMVDAITTIAAETRASNRSETRRFSFMLSLAILAALGVYPVLERLLS